MGPALAMVKTARCPPHDGRKTAEPSVFLDGE